MSKKAKHAKTQDPLVDVVIPVYGNYEFLPKSLEMLRTSFQDVPYAVYFTDDKSPELDEVGRTFWRDLKLNFPEIKNVLIHSVNTGYGKSVNDSAVLGRGKHILILNSDVLLLDHAAKFMANHLSQNDGVGIVFPKLLFFPNSNDARRPSGKIQHAGVVFDINRKPYHIYLGWDAEHPLVNRVRDYNACSGAAFMIKRDLWRSLKGYDLIYGKGYYEDIDLCMRVRMNGQSIRYLPMCIGFHFTNASFEKYQVPAPMTVNEVIFRERFGNNIPYDEFFFSQ